MKTTSILSTLASVIAVANAGCFDGGDGWGPQDVAMATARQACNQLAGTYGPAGSPSGLKGVCKDANGKRLEFQIFHLDDGSRQLSAEECFTGLEKEVGGCDNGGDTSSESWRFKADPNSGSCPK
ncbi:hypothetical protein B0H63DRAFT_522071 [Podospora didyma]|uniref:Secreted protein n=1 Tax=Podospora didyma TaxID=330526 RepID=A0AAE0NUS8_9PEZI|nr:hypothetical protein B0H63DRAFT_522071 [Podospora didyma]